MTPRSLRAAATLAALAALLAGCGKLGSLERPRPLWGHPKSAADAASGEIGQDPSRPIRTIDPRDNNLDPSTNSLPQRSAPIQGTSPDPTATAPKGALPDPYANPQ